MFFSRSLWACTGISSVLGQDLFISSVPKDSYYEVGLQRCGNTAVFQSWVFDNATGLVEMQQSIPDVGPFCLGVDMGKHVPIVAECNKEDSTLSWAQDPSSSVGHLYRHAASDLCLKGSTDSKSVSVGDCNNDLVTGWFEDEQAFPSNMLRTVVLDSQSGQRQCLSAIPQKDLPGDPPIQNASICQQVMELLPNISVPFIGPIDAPLGIRASLENLTLQLPDVLQDFTVCGFYDAAPGGLVSHKGTLTLDMDIPQVPFKVPWWHFERPPAHGSGSADGWAHAVISLVVEYDLAHPNLQCSSFDIKLPDLKLKLHGGGGWEPLVKSVQGAIGSVIEDQVPALADPLVCPEINKLAESLDQCSDAISRGPVAFALCVLNGPKCRTKPCYACNHENGTCSEVPRFSSHSTSSLEDCSKGCYAPAPPPPPCISDGACADGALAHSCCTGRYHRTEHCTYGRCGCLEAGVCADHKDDCCSLSGHKTAKCSLGIGYRCN